MKQVLGFTLIELLVVIAIVGILAGVGITTYNGALQRSRDARRITDLREIKEALRKYEIDNIHLPCEKIDCDRSNSSAGVNGRIGIGGTIDTLIAPYLQEVPTDPVNSGLHYYYYDGYHYCEDADVGIYVSVIFARTMEAEGSGNLDELCGGADSDHWGGEGNGGNSDYSDIYAVIVGPSPDQ